MKNEHNFLHDRVSRVIYFLWISVGFWSPKNRTDVVAFAVKYSKIHFTKLRVAKLSDFVGMIIHQVECFIIIMIIISIPVDKY